MTTIRCPDCSTSNAKHRQRCRGCGAVLRRSGAAVVPPAEGPARAASPPKKGKPTRLVLDIKMRRIHEMEAAAKRRAYEKEKRLLAWEAALERREKELGRGAAGTPWSAEGKVSGSARAAVRTKHGPVASDGHIPRIPTHVPGLDAALGGGIPRGSVVLIAGAPGTMKTSLGLFILAHNAISDLRGGLYITFGERATSVLRQMETLGLDVSRTDGRLRVVDATARSPFAAKGRRAWLYDLRRRLGNSPAERPQLLVLDSLQALEVVAKFENRREELFRLFEWLRDLGLTTFVIAERPDFIIRGNVFQGRHDEDFLADGMIHLRLHPVTDVEVQRRIRIVKMRGTAHDTGYLALNVGKEFEVAPAIGA